MPPITSIPSQPPSNQSRLLSIEPDASRPGRTAPAASSSAQRTEIRAAPKPRAEIRAARPVSQYTGGQAIRATVREGVSGLSIANTLTGSTLKGVEASGAAMGAPGHPVMDIHYARHMDDLARYGRYVKGVDIGLRAAQVATSEDPTREAVMQTAGLAGAWAGGTYAASFCSPSMHPVVIGACTVGGALVGGFFGDQAAQHVAGAVVDWVREP